MRTLIHCGTYLTGGSRFRVVTKTHDYLGCAIHGSGGVLRGDSGFQTAQRRVQGIDGESPRDYIDVYTMLGAGDRDAKVRVPITDVVRIEKWSDVRTASSREMLNAHFSAHVEDKAFVYDPESEQSDTLWIWTGVCPDCYRRAISVGRCVQCGWVPEKGILR